MPTVSSKMHQKKVQGAYFTPPDIADFLVGWAVQPSTTRILEPSVGDGAFLGAIGRRARVLESDPACVAIEKDIETCRRAEEMYGHQGLEFVAGDFFRFRPAASEMFDAIVGNPPWIRSASVPIVDRELAQAACVRSAVRLSAIASLWAPFVVHSVSLLRPGGRLAMVLPAELLQVDYAAEIRVFLQQRFSRLVVLRFTEHIFSDASVDAVLLLASNDGEPGVWVGHLPGPRNLRTYERWLSRHEGGRWSPFNVEPAAMDLLKELAASGRFTTLGSIADVRIGTVTGFNSYFVLRSSDLVKYEIPRDLVVATICHPRQLATRTIDATKIGELDRADEPMWLLRLSPATGARVSEYLAFGADLGVPERYKCRTRKPWFAVRVERAPDLFLAYMSHIVPRLAVNTASAISTNLVHGVYLSDSAQRERMGSEWLNPATALSCEIVGRTYGGGVLKLEPSEAKRILVPSAGGASKLSDAEAEVLERSWRARVRARISRGGGKMPTSVLELAA